MLIHLTEKITNTLEYLGSVLPLGRWTQNGLAVIADKEIYGNKGDLIKMLHS